MKAYLEAIYGEGCPLCGCKGIHACTGEPIPDWTKEEKDKFEEVMQEIFKENQNDNNESNSTSPTDLPS